MSFTSAAAHAAAAHAASHSAVPSCNEIVGLQSRHQTLGRALTLSGLRLQLYKTTEGNEISGSYLYCHPHNRYPRLQ